MTDKERTIKELKEALDSLDITNKYRLNLIRAIEYLQEEPLSEKKCMFTKDNYTDEDRMILCEKCKEKCEYSKKEEPVSESIDFEQELYKAFGQVKDFTLSMRIAKWFYDMGKNSQEPVSEELEEAASNYAEEHRIALMDYETGEIEMNKSLDVVNAFKAGAKWQKEKDQSCPKDLGEYINELSKQFPEVSFAKLSRIAVRVAQWQKEHLWTPADGDDLPECNREVIALEDDRFCGYKVVFAHRPNPNGWDGKSLSTGKVEHYTPKTYDKGGWNIPDIKFWLDVELPKEIEL